MRADRLLIAFLLLIGAFVVLVGVAVNSMLMVGQYLLAAMVGGAGLAGMVAGGVTFWWLRQDAEEVVEVEPWLRPAEAVVAPVVPAPFVTLSNARASVVRPKLARAEAQPRLPMKVQAMPVADLPPAYVDAVLKGAHARLDALKAEARHTAAR
jgi:hypothetical protein